MGNTIYTNKNGQMINLTLYYFKIDLKHYTEDITNPILNPCLMEMSCKLCPVFVIRSSLSVPSMLS